jgi:hypothetical protein
MTHTTGTTDKVCEMQACTAPATCYGGYKGADDWAGYICFDHADGLGWYEELDLEWVAR